MLLDLSVNLPYPSLSFFNRVQKAVLGWMWQVVKDLYKMLCKAHGKPNVLRKQRTYVLFSKEENARLQEQREKFSNFVKFR